jgi:DNA topoisomerase VI subunit A
MDLSVTQVTVGSTASNSSFSVSISQQGGDFTALKEALQKAEALSEEDFAIVEEAYYAAKTVKLSAEQSEIDALASSLNEAIESTATSTQTERKGCNSTVTALSVTILCLAVTAYAVYKKRANRA